MTVVIVYSVNIAKSTPNNVFPKSECVYVSETCLPNAPRG